MRIYETPFKFIKDFVIRFPSLANSGYIHFDSIFIRCKSQLHQRIRLVRFYLAKEIFVALLDSIDFID